jgi:hypothetical protein
MTDIAKYATDEGGLWKPWTAGPVDGRSFNKRGKATVKINDVDVHALEAVDGRQWDCRNGWRIPAPASTQPVVLPVLAPAPAVCDAQAYALRVWSGQTDTIPRNERLRRVEAALTGQGMTMEGVELP